MSAPDHRCACGRAISEHERGEHNVRIPGSGAVMFLADGTNLAVDEDPNLRSLRQLQEQKDRIINEQAATLAKVLAYVSDQNTWRKRGYTVADHVKQLIDAESTP